MQPGKCVVHATIKSILKRYKWWFNGCSQEKCSKAVVADGAEWFCSRCKKSCPSIFPMYWHKTDSHTYRHVQYFKCSAHSKKRTFFLTTISCRFKVELLVMDITDTATFILFGKDAEQLLNVTAPELMHRVETRVCPLHSNVTYYILTQ